MAKVQLQVEELLQLAGVEVSDDVQKKIGRALLQVVEGEEFNRAVNARVDKLMEERTESLMKKAEEAALRGATVWFQQQVTWQADNVTTKAVAAAEIAARKYYESTQQTRQAFETKLTHSMTDLVKQLIPTLVSQEYKDRVVERFDELGVPKMVEKEVKAALGRMFGAAAPQE